MRSANAVTGQDVRQVVTLAVGTLRQVSPDAWHAPAAELDWTRWETAEHVANVLFTYAVRFGLAQPPVSGLMPFRPRADRDDGPQTIISTDPESGPEGLLTILEACGGLLASVQHTADPATVAYHVYGPSNPEGFAAMGIVETLVHTHDVLQGLDVRWSPPRGACERVLRRIFPHVTVDGDAWEVLLWATGRAELPGRPRLTEWRWYGEG
ncbi:DinB family protein [Nonomuraea gerenzanensis]|uniref:Ribosomal-protein-alanine acetyltransferase n=1 Tax=Nonomuraea gerenzanensis TaxID=93944 RepID=A0A1M4E371_9ACTN|nr:DinB family protein [Nonomuraea gerenzanensis]UBU15505.1 maleylpyruvate isomerase N-terminal domain-containing protein [Nonomuraea gerenzanensis]SBO93267.1 Ribosomal-protein-alanine acetyltransferase [Nonomuraea gerenzanensis]